MKWPKDRVGSSETVYRRDSVPSPSIDPKVEPLGQEAIDAFDRWASASKETWDAYIRDIPSFDDVFLAKVRDHVVLDDLLKKRLAISRNLIRTGHLVPLDHDKTPHWSRLRGSLKLTPVPPTVASFPDALKEVQAILKATGFVESIERADARQKQAQ